MLTCILRVHVKILKYRNLTFTDINIKYLKNWIHKSKHLNLNGLKALPKTNHSEEPKFDF
jgi:hypothetical protein